MSKNLKILTVLVHANASTGLPLTIQLESCSDTGVFGFETQSNCEKHFPVAALKLFFLSVHCVLKRVVVILKL